MKVKVSNVKSESESNVKSESERGRFFLKFPHYNPHVIFFPNIQNNDFEKREGLLDWEISISL